MNLRKEARGRECQVRSPVCNFNPETTILAHYREIGISGTGFKAPDILGSHCCSACHVLVDAGQYDGVSASNTQRDLMLLRGMARTIALLVSEGKIKV